ARLKLLAALPSELQERATRAQRLFHLDARGWFRAEDSVPHLPALASAVWAGCRVRIRYREGRKVVQRTIDPLGLVLKAGAWYLVAHRVAGMRVYRVSRIASVRALDDRCERPDGFELAAYWQEWSLAFENSRPRVEVTVRGAKGERTMTFESFEDARRELLRFGAGVEVLEPAELRASLAQTAREVAALYVP
ncbi:MAG TPA: WYL domain-containing protein, partial [Gaiellaceae bacterium]